MKISVVETNGVKIAILRYSKKTIFEASAEELVFDTEINGACIVYPSCRKRYGQIAIANKIVVKLLKCLNSVIKTKCLRKDFLIPIKETEYEVITVLPESNYSTILHAMSAPIQDMI